MKTCKNCKSKIEDDALVCPNCGCVVKRNGKITKTENVTSSSDDTMTSNNEQPKKKRKTWLWVLGWIFIFPIPLTILLLRNQKINRIFKIIIIVVAWLIYLVIITSSNSNESSTTNQSSKSTNVESLTFSNQDDVTVKVGENYTSGSLDVDVKNKNNFSPEEDLIFISDNPEIATFTFTKVSYGTILKYEITGVDGGETDVYVTSKDGNVMSEKLHVIVPEPIKVETIELSGYTTDLAIGEVIEVLVTITPYDANDKELTWTSSDEAVATVDEEGNVTAIGGGTTTITASSSNGIESSFDINVDDTKTLMKLKVTHPREDDVDIGDEWSYDVQVNGEHTSNTIAVSVGETLNFYAKFTESDDNPDVGTAQTSYTVTEDDIANGFTVTMDLYVTENGGRNSGQSAHFVVTYTFSPNN